VSPSDMEFLKTTARSKDCKWTSGSLPTTSSIPIIQCANVWTRGFTSSSAKLNVSESETEGSGIFRGLDDLNEIAVAESEDWRTPLICYLENTSHVIYTKVRRQALKYVLLYHDLYLRIIDGLLLGCLGSDQFKVTMESS
jgi:hypothetical protein